MDVDTFEFTLSDSALIIIPDRTRVRTHHSHLDLIQCSMIFFDLCVSKYFDELVSLLSAWAIEKCNFSGFLPRCQLSLKIKDRYSDNYNIEIFSCYDCL